jgi:hypothetical protein
MSRLTIDQELFLTPSGGVTEGRSATLIAHTALSLPKLA